MNKQEVLDHFLKKRANWDEFVRRLSIPQLTQPNTCGKWSAKDAIAHVAVWERYATAIVPTFRKAQAVCRGCVRGRWR